ncbi:EpsG family protein [Vreelandella subterranea]|uniref:EpsG family protein n=1 Tax=Vreelandella subterranea TaxID=416874 RepID=A0A1H9RRS2_9GAMM|nr:EpsG family protein [Halomonas subterranea]SER75284.1 EpsG family protein [Halomonas subterranea]
MLYWVFYTSYLFFAFSSLLVASKKIRFAVYIIFFFAFLFFIGLRFESVDYGGYYQIWQRVGFDVFSFPFYTAGGGTTGNEFLFATSVSFFKYYGLSFEFFLFFISFVSLSIKFYFFKKLSPYFLLCLLLYFSLGFFKDLGQIRNSLAAAILLFGLSPLYKRSFFRYFLVITCASAVQIFAVIALPFYWLYPILKIKYLPYFLLVFSFLVSLIGGFGEFFLFAVDTLFIPEEIKDKVKGYYYSDRNQLLYYHPLNLSFFIFSLIFLYFRSFFEKLDERLFSLLGYHFFSVFLYFLMFDFSPVAGRVFELLSFNSVIVLLACLTSLFKGLERVFYILFLLIYSTLLFYSVVGSAASYKNILFSFGGLV